MIKMEKNGLVKLIQKGIEQIGRDIVANRTTHFPYTITAGKRYFPVDVAVKLDKDGILERGYLCLKEDDLGNPVAVPIEYFNV